MKQARRAAAFTLAELLIAMVGTSIIIGALLLSSVSLQKAFRASELYAASQADQRRLIDYLARDLRRAVGIATSANINGSAAVKVGTAPVSVDERTALILSLPGYYKSNVPANEDFDEPMPVMVSGRRADYASTTFPAPGVPVIFRKVYIAEEKGVCFVRQEAEAQEIIVRRAETLRTQVTFAADGTSCGIEVWFDSPFGRTKPLVAAYDQIMLRNTRID